MAKKDAIEQIEIEAPYELPEGWNWEKLGNLFSHTTGKALNKENTVGALKKYITTSNLYWNTFDFSDVREMYFTEDELEKCTATKGDLLICNGGDVGRAAIWNFDYDICIQNHISKLRKKSDSVSTEFFYYIFLFYKDLGLLSGKGIGIASLSAKTITNLIIPLPPTLAEQKRIVNRIESMFAKLDQAQEKAQAVLDSFETRKAAILHKAFTGQLTANWRKANGVSDDSWEEKTIGEIASKITDGEHSTPKRVDEFCGYYLLSARNIHNGQIVLDDVDYVAKDEYDRIRKRCNPDKDDILISCSGSVGRVCVIQDDNKYVMVRSAAMVKLEKDNPFYVSYMLQSFNVQQQIEKTKKQSCQANLFLGAIKELTIPLPTYTEQIEIVIIIDRIRENEEKAKQAAEIVLQQIDILKKSILARAFRGEL